VLFAVPDVHSRKLDKLWVDGLMHHVAWADFMKKLIREWQEFTLFAAVLLNANVAFLAFQSFDIFSSTPFHRSPAQIASYLSVVVSIGSILLGLLLIRKNRDKSEDTIDEVLEFLQSHKHPTRGLEALAIMYSLPYALLIWGIISFLSAFALVWFTGTSLTTQLLIAVACLAMAALVIWCIWMSRGSMPRVVNEDTHIGAEANATEEKVAQRC